MFSKQDLQFLVDLQLLTHYFQTILPNEEGLQPNENANLTDEKEEQQITAPTQKAGFRAPQTVLW